MAGQVDRFGQPIPNDPGYQVIINPDGSQPQMRNTLRLATGLIASDDPNSQATLLTSTGGSSGGGIYPISASTVDITGATPVNATWPALLATLMAQGYEGIDQTGAILKFSAGVINVPTRAQNVGFRIIGGTYDGTTGQNGPFGPFLTAGISSETFPSSGYGARFFNATITPGQLTFVGVASVAGLAIGDVLFVRLGADPSNIDGWYCQYYATITNISGSDITVDTPPPELPQNPVTPFPSLAPSWNVNINRISTKHDVFKMTGFQDDLIFESPIIKSMTFDSQFCRRQKFIRPVIISGSVPFRMSFCVNYRHVDPYFYRIDGYNGGGYSADFGFGYTNYGSYGCEITNFECPEITAAGGVWDEEQQARGTHFSGVTRATFSLSGQNSGWVAGTGLQQAIVIDHLVAGAGAGTAINSGNVEIGKLEKLTLISIGNDLNKVDYVRLGGSGIGEEWSQKITNTQLFAPPVNATTDFTIPTVGLPRNLLLYSSTLTGVTDVLLVRADTGTQSIFSYLTAAGWGKLDRFITDLDSSIGVGNRDLPFKLRVVTAADYPAAGYFNLKSEFFIKSRNLYDSTFSNTSFTDFVCSDGAPSFNAQWVGQVCFDKTNSKYYDSVSIGGGAADWVLRGGSASAITSLTGDGTASGPGAAAFTLESVGSASTVGDASHVCVVTTDEKGRVTAKTLTAIAIASSEITDATAAGIAMLDAATAVAQAALLGSTIPTAGTNIPDADTTVSLAGGAHYIMPTATAARIVTLGTSGSPSTGEVILVDFTRTGAFAVTVKDDAGTTLFQVPASVKMTLTASWDGAHFSNARAIRIQ